MEDSGEEKSIGKLSAELARYGLTPNQAETYIALTKRSWSSALEISRLTGKHHEETYRSLDNLQKLGLVSVMPGRPVKYLALPPEESLNLLIDRESRRLQYLLDKKDSLVEDLKGLELGDEQTPDLRGFRWIADKTTSESFFRKAVNTSKSRIALTLTIGELRMIQFKELKDMLSEANKRGITIQILTDVAQGDIRRFGAMNIGQVRYRGNIPLGMGIFDGTQARILFQPPREEKELNVIEIWSPNKAFVAAVTQIYSELWETAVDFKTIIELV